MTFDETTINNLNNKNNVPSWFEDLTRTLNSRGISISEWNILINNLRYIVSDLNTLIEFLKEFKVSNADVKDDAIATSNIIDASVTTDKLSDSAVTKEKITDNAVTEGKLANNSVTTNKLKDGSVTTGKISDKAVTPEKLSKTYVTFSDTATASKAGVVKAQPDGNSFDGIGITDNGMLGIVAAPKSRIDEARFRRMPVGVDNFAYAVRKALVNPTDRPGDVVVPLEWTAEQQSAARKTLGIDTYVQEFFDSMTKAEESEF